MAQWIRTIEPVLEPLTIAEAKLHLRLSQANEDGLIQSSISVARDAAEAYLGRGLLTQTWKLTLECFGDLIWLPMAAPLQSVSVQYYDVNGALQTLSTSIYTVDTVSRPGRIVRASNQIWPALQADRLDGAVAITYVVGWTAPNLIPERIKQGIRVYLGYLECDREGLEANALAARNVAEGFWDDRVYWQPPQWAYPWSTPYGWPWPTLVYR